MNIINTLAEKIDNSLKINKSDNIFKIIDTTDNSDTDSLKELHIISDQNDILVLKQQNQHAIDKILIDMPTAKKCDCIIITEKNNKLCVTFCEIKTTLTKKAKENAKTQIFSSQLFIDYLISYYNKYLNDFLSQPASKVEIIERKNIIVYARLGISNKSTTYVPDIDSDSTKIIYYPKQVDIDAKKGIAELAYTDLC